MWHFVSSLLISVLLFVFITFRQLTKLSCWSTRRVGSVLMNVRKMLSFFFFPEMLPALLSSNFVKHSLWYWGSCNFSKTPSKLSLSWTIVGLKNFGSSPQNCSCTRWRTFRPSLLRVEILSYVSVSTASQRKAIRISFFFTVYEVW